MSNIQELGDLYTREKMAMNRDNGDAMAQRVGGNGDVMGMKGWG